MAEHLRLARLAAPYSVYLLDNGDKQGRYARRTTDG